MCLVLLTACASTITDDTPKTCGTCAPKVITTHDMTVGGVINGYLTWHAMRDYHGDVIHVGVAHTARERGELLSLEFAPVAFESRRSWCGWNGTWIGVGAGVLGARVQLFLFELSLGTFWFDPSPPGPGSPTWCVDPGDGCTCKDKDE